MTRTTARQIKRLSAVHAACEYCGAKFTRRPTRDHIVPVSAGGSNTLANIALVCRACNMRKGGWTPDRLLLWAERISAIAQSRREGGAP